MKNYYVGNFSSWIDNKWIEYLNNYNGDLLPKNIKDVSDEKNIRDKKYRLTFQNWDKDRVSCIAFSDHNFPFKFSMPLNLKETVIDWNFIKLKSGMMIPLKTPEDEDLVNIKSLKRYKMFLQNYEFGHIFMVNGELITDYKLGDMFKYDDTEDWNGTVNITNNPYLFFDIITE